MMNRCVMWTCASIVLACSPGLRQNAIPPAHADQQQARYIGECWMDEDGTIRMFLRAEAETDGGTIVGHALQQYRPGDEQYEEILKHVGPMRPGDRRPVPAWPD